MWCFWGAFLVYPNEWFQWIPFVYLLALYLLFTVYMSVAVRHYERWLNDNYADLEYKRVWLSQVVGFFFLLLFILYMLVETNFVLVGLLLWRVESLPSLTSDPSPNGEGQGESLLTEMEHLLDEHCVDARLYLEHDLTLQ